MLLIKGCLIGFFMLVPGISGGSIAILLDMYEEIVFNTSNLFKNFKVSFWYLFFVFVGGLIGMVISSYILDYLITNFYLELIYFFVGVMLIFIIKYIKKTMKLKQKWYQVLYIGIGIIVSLLVDLIPKDIFNANNNYFYLFLFGLCIAIALILPGISVSYMLLVFSCYEPFLIALKNIDLIYIFKLFMFVPLGIMLTIKLLEKMFNRFESITNYIIIGFMIGSLIMFVPIPESGHDLTISLLFLLQGILIFLIFGKIIKE
jgi:putative membrane protein